LHWRNFAACMILSFLCAWNQCLTPLDHLSLYAPLSVSLFTVSNSLITLIYPAIEIFCLSSAESIHCKSSSFIAFV
jgi:ABC-type glycerol-3-phosphate transport system permease component